MVYIYIYIICVYIYIYVYTHTIGYLSSMKKSVIFMQYTVYVYMYLYALYHIYISLCNLCNIPYMYTCTYVYIYIHTHTHTHTIEYHSAIKIECSLVICNNMAEPGEHRASWNMSDKDKYCIFTYIWNLNNKAN